MFYSYSLLVLSFGVSQIPELQPVEQTTRLHNVVESVVLKTVPWLSCESWEKTAATFSPSCEISALCSAKSHQWFSSFTQRWLQSVCKTIQIRFFQLKSVKEMKCGWNGWSLNIIDKKENAHVLLWLTCLQVLCTS